MGNDSDSGVSYGALKPYVLEIYVPGSGQDLLKKFESDKPFMPIAVGDIISSRAMDVSERTGRALLRVVAIEHMFFGESPTMKHQVCVYTDAVPDTPESRRSIIV